jgi:hypothetical protein
MPIVGINITSVNAHYSDKKVEGTIDVNSTPIVEDIRKKEINFAGLTEVLIIEFKFVTTYNPKIGEIEIRGEVVYQAEDTKKILSLWKEKKVDSKIAVEVLNVIFKKCLTKSIQLADDLRLPPPVTLPKVTSAPEKKDDSE